MTDGRVVLVDSYRAEDLFGDATVPTVGACRADVVVAMVGESLSPLWILRA